MGVLYLTKLYDKRYYFDFRIVNFPYICNISETIIYGVHRPYTSQL